MADSHVYDKAKYHYDGSYPDDLSVEQAFVHTGMFLGWIIDHDLFSGEFKEDMEWYINAFKAREMTGAKVYQVCDGALVDDMLSEEGNAFALGYFDFEAGQYLADYDELLGQDMPSLYHVEDTWANYALIASRISERYAEWKRKRA